METFHHGKWIVLSVHHAAQIFCIMLLKEFDPTNAIFKSKRESQDRWPSLVQAIRELLATKYRTRLTGAEIQLLNLLRKLNKSRNRIMHGIAPEGLDLSLAAMSILGLSRVAHRRRGESVRDILQADSSIQSYVVDAISYKKFDDYYRFVEAFLAEEFPGKYLPNAKIVGQVVLSTCDAKHALSAWNPFIVRVARNSYYQNPGESEVKLKSYVLLAVRKSLTNNPLQSDHFKVREHSDLEPELLSIVSLLTRDRVRDALETLTVKRHCDLVDVRGCLL